MTAATGAQYEPPKVAGWKPPAMLAILAALVVGIIAVSRAMGDDGSTAQTVVTFAMVAVALALIVLVSAVGAVRRPMVVTGLVMVSVVLVSLLPLGMAIGVEAYRALVVRPICQEIETDTMRYDRVSGTADGVTSIERYFSRRLECHYRTVDAAVPEGIPSSVDLADERLAGNRAWLVRWGHTITAIVGFLVLLVAPIPIWRWWFRSMMREVRQDRGQGEDSEGSGAEPVGSF